MNQQGSAPLPQGSASLILDAVRAAGTVSRVGIAQVTGLTGASVTNIVRKLIEQGLVVEVGRAESTGGKPRTLLQLNASARYAVGVHLDHSAITYVITDLAGTSIVELIRHGSIDLPPQETVALMAREISRLIEQQGIDRSLVLGVGLVSPGPLSSTDGIRLAPAFMKDWEDFPLDTALADLSGFPVLLENDATASAVGEYWSGGTEREANFAVLYMGTGFGAGIFTHGSHYRGASGNAGEIGHTSVDLNGPQCWCGMRGCVELLAGPAALVARAEANPALSQRLGLIALGQDVATAVRFAQIAQHARNGDPEAAALFHDSARYVAAAAHTIANILDLPMLVLTGASFEAASDFYLEAIAQTLAATHFSRANHTISVRLSKTAVTAAAIGGAALVLQTALVPERSSLFVRNVRATGLVSEIATISS